MQDMKLLLECWRIYEDRQLEPIKPPPKVEVELPEGPEEEPERRYGSDGHEYVRFPGGPWPGKRKWYQTRWQTSPWGDLEKPRPTYYLTDLTDDDQWWNAPSGTKLPDYAMKISPRGRPHPQAIHPDLVDPSPETEASPGRPRLALPMREVNTNYNMRDMKFIMESFRSKTTRLFEEDKYRYDHSNRSSGQ